MGENGFLFSPISRHFLSFLLFLDTFSLILDPKVSRNGNDPKSVTDAGPEQPFRCLDVMSAPGLMIFFPHKFFLQESLPLKSNGTGRDECQLIRGWTGYSPTDKEGFCLLGQTSRWEGARFCWGGEGSKGR